MTEKPPYYSNDDLRRIEHRVVDAATLDEFSANDTAFFEETGSKFGDIIVSNSLFNKLITEARFSGHFDPTCKFEKVRRGFIGLMDGHQIFTDAYEHPDSPTRIFADGGRRPQMILLQQKITTD